MSAGTDSLDVRPGWAALRQAAEQLHAAELLVGDPIATPATAIPHLDEFWRAIARAGVAAGIGEHADDPNAWLEKAPPGLDPELRQALLAQLRSLAAEQPPSKRELRAHADKELDDDPVIVREDSIEHDWKDRAPHEKLAPDKFSVRWDTSLRIDEAGPVVFQVNANDGARVLVDGEVLIDAWDRNPGTRRRGFGSGELELDAGVHHLRVEYFESSGSARIKLSASLDGSLPAELPRDRLSYPGDEFDEQDPWAAVR